MGFFFWVLAGEVALPGGKTEEGDKDDGDTATREAKEEIGLDPSLVNIVTVLEPFLSKVSTYFLVYSNYVLLGKNCKLVPKLLYRRVEA